MQEKQLPKVVLRTRERPPRGTVSYQSIPEMVEFQLAGRAPVKARGLALGRVLFTLDAADGSLVAVISYVKTSRWRTEEAEPPPEPDAEGRLSISVPEDAEDLTYMAANPRFLWHEDSSSLRISFSEGTALVFRVADRMLVGVDRGGRLTDIWMTGLELGLEQRESPPGTW